MIRFLLLIAAVGLGACGGSDIADETVRDVPITVESAAEMSMPDMADKLIADSQSLNTLLAQVDSVETAEDIRPEIEAMVSDYQILFKRFETMGEPSFSEMAALASRAPQLAATQQAISQQVKRIYNDHPEAANILRDTLDNIGRPAP